MGCEVVRRRKGSRCCVGVDGVYRASGRRGHVRGGKWDRVVAAEQSSRRRLRVGRIRARPVLAVLVGATKARRARRASRARGIVFRTNNNQP